MTDEFIPTLTHATERDIDLLLVEELFASPEFVRWMFEQAGLPNEIESARVLHSKRRTRSRREIDIFVDVQAASGERAALLIENKLDATEQPDQAESYREELDAIADQFARRAMVIVCPSQYAAQHSEFVAKFDAVIPYETLSGYFGSRKQHGVEAVRMRFRRDLIDQAIGKARRGYAPVPNAVIGGFNAQYVALLAQLAPEILPGATMLKEANPDDSVSMIFDHKRSLGFLPEDIRPSRFAHELGRGSTGRANYVAVVFPGWGAAINELREEFEHDTVSIGARFSAKRPTKVRPNPGLVMYCATKPIDNQADFRDQMCAVARGIERAIKLRDWLQDSEAVLRRWQARVRELGVVA